MADVTYNYIKAFNSVPFAEDPKQWFSLTITNSNPTPESTLTLRGGDYFIINYSGGQNYKYVFEVGGPTIPASDNEINVLLGANDYECFINLRNAILNTEFLVTDTNSPGPGVIGDKYAYAGSSGPGFDTTTHHQAVGVRLVDLNNLEINVSEYYWNTLDNGSETLEVRGQIGAVAVPPFFTGTIGTTPITQGIGEVGENLSQDPTAIGERVNAFHQNYIEWQLDAPASAGGFFEVLRVVTDGTFDVTQTIARFPANFDPFGGDILGSADTWGVGGTLPDKELANFSRISFRYDSTEEKYTFYDNFSIDERPNCPGSSPQYPIFSDYDGTAGDDIAVLTSSTPVMGTTFIGVKNSEFYNNINNSEIQQYARPSSPYPTPLDFTNGGVRYEVRFIDVAGTINPSQDAVPQGEVEPAQNGNFESFGLVRAERPSLGLVEQTCDAGGEGCDLYRTRVFIPGQLFGDTTAGYNDVASNEQFLLELIGDQIYNNDISSICSFPTAVGQLTFIREVNGVEEIIDPFAVDNPAGNLSCDIRFFTGIFNPCAVDDLFYTSRDGTECENEDGIPTIPVLCDTLDSLNYYIEATYEAIPASASGSPACPADAVTITGRVKVQPFLEIAQATAFTEIDVSCFGDSLFQVPVETLLPCCPRLTGVTASIGDCFSEQQGEVTISWNFELGDGETPVDVVIDRNASTPAGTILAESTTLPPEYGQLSGGWIDTGVLLPVSCSGPETVIYDVTLNYTDAAGNVLSTTQSVEVEVPCCADDCGDVEDPCNLCWGVDGADVKIYLESYFENPLATPKEASFQIKYCINNACADGIDSAEVYVTLPVGIEVTGFNSDAAGVSFEESFLGGIYPGRWKFIVPSGSATSLLPSFGVLGTVIMDKPLGDAVACIDEENSSVTVDYTTDGGGIQAYEPDTNFSYSGATGTEDWQTGPCLSTCTDEVDMGFGDFHYSMDAVDNSIFDVKYCLTQGSIDSFVLVCLTGDFKTTVTAIDAEFGDVALRGWSVNFRNLAPGFTVIYGRGSRPIPTSGLSTLMRVYLSDNILQRNPAGEESCMCVFPVFMNLGSLFPLVSNYIVNLNTQTNINLKDSEKVSGTTEASFTADEPTTSGAITTSFTRDISAFTSDAVVRETSISANFTPPSSEGYQIGSGFIADLETIGEQLDERFKPLLDCLKVSYGRAITDYQNDEVYARETRENAIRTVHYFRIFFTIWAALIRSIPNLAAKFENSVQTVDTSCTNAIGVIFDCEEIDGDSYIRCNVTYDASLCAISGIELDIKEFQEFIDDSGNNVTYSDVYSWVGDASDKSYFQAYSTSTGRYVSTYGANLAQRRDSNTQIEYLRTDKSTDVSIVPQYLTTIYLKVENFINWGVSKFNFENNICTTVFDSKDDDVAWNLLDDPLLPNYVSFVALRKAIKIGLNKATLVTNEKTTIPAGAWTGNSFAPSGTQVVDVKDFLTTMVNVVEPDTFDLSEENLETLVKLPSGTTATTLKKFYDLDDIDLSGVTYSPSGTNPYTDPTGNYILPLIDANADGRVDVIDLVALRNTWLYSGKYPLSDTATISARQIVPTECCLKIDTDAEILVPDQCSQFCIQPPCYGKVWLSDMLLIKDEFGRPDRYVLEVSYGVNCADETVAEINYPVQDVSGIQFRVEGLSSGGIISSINGFGKEEGKTATAIKAREWSEYILSSDTVTKDTFISFSANQKYIEKGKGVLCYLAVEPSSIPDAETYLASRFEEEYITTNKFIKFETSPDVVGVSEVAGSKIGYPLANLRFNSHHTDELLIFERFGIRVMDYKMTTNRYYNDSTENYIDLTTDPALSWTGDRTGDGIDDSDLKFVLQLAATKTYDTDFDADASGKIDIIDIQAVSNTINSEVFNFGTSVVPRYCCDLGELPAPVLSVVDYTSGDITLPVVQNGKIRSIELDGASLGCGAAVENQGGVLLYWDTLKFADYYVVYRKGQNDTSAIPIIAAGPGNRNRIGSFPTEDRSAERDPISILPNMWIDYPPIKEDDCCSLASFDVDAYFSGDVATAVTNEIETRLGTTITPGATSESFTYWIVAISRDGDVRSAEQTGAVSCCSFEPITSDVFINTTTNKSFSAKFDAYHPLASRPLGSSDRESGEAFPIWFFAQNSVSGNGRDGTTDKGGIVRTESKLPDRSDASGMNQRGFVYTPKPGFVGKDSFKYVATILDLKNRFRPSTWCKSVSTVTAYVAPPPPTLLARAGSNSIAGEKDKAFLSWSGQKGATSYRLYRDSVLIDTVEAEVEKSTRYKFTDSSPSLPTCPVPGDSVENVYEVSSVYLDPDGTEIESAKNSATVAFVCPPDLDTIGVTITLTQVGFNIPIGGTRLSTGTIVATWPTVTNAEYYSVFRKQTASSDWSFVGRTTTTTFRDKISSCNDCSSSQSYDYYITAIANNYQSDPSPTTTTIIPCYDDFVPQVSDKTATMQERGTLSSFVTARAIQGTISTYTLITPPASDEGILTFNPDGTFTFIAALNFIGTTQFEWQAQDSCGNTSNALFTINVEAVSTNTNLEYVIGDANEVTSQQNATQVRIRNRKTSQVPFMLNNKGASSLRKRCFAFAVTRGIEPFSWAPGTDGCSTPTRFPPLDPTIDPGDLCTDPTIGSAIIGSSKIGGCE